jgi:IMP dehydrogenase
MAVPQFKEIRKAYGFDDVAISPGVVTINPDQVNREFSINGMTMPMPVLACRRASPLNSTNGAAWRL